MKLIQRQKIIFILLLAAVLRFYNLGEMPPGITNDEAGYIYNAYSISRTLRDVNAKLLPLSFNLDNPFSPVPIYLNAFFLRVFNLTVGNGRFLYALLGTASVFLLYLIADLLFKNKKIALASAFVLAISPWHLHLSRSAYETVVALFFYFLAFLVFLKKAAKGNINQSLPFFLLAFYSYHAIKIFFLPFVLILLVTHRNLFKRKKQLTIFMVGIFFIILSFVYVGKTQQGFTRAGLFLFKDLNTAARIVDAERAKSSAPFMIRQVFNNKPLYFLRVMRENYLSVFSPQFLFLHGETSGLAGLYGTFLRGVMYIIELPLLILGAAVLVQKYRLARKIIFFSLLAAPLTTTFTVDASYVARAIMMLPFLCLLVGLGIETLLAWFQKYSLFTRRVLMVVFACWYFFLLTSYLYQYHFRYSIYGAEYWFKSNRDLITLIEKQGDNYDQVWIANPDKMFLLQYGVWAKVSPGQLQSVWQMEPPRRLGKITFLTGCLDKKGPPANFLDPGTLYVVPDICHQEAKPLSRIVNLGEPLQTIWKIYEAK